MFVGLGPNNFHHFNGQDKLSSIPPHSSFGDGMNSSDNLKLTTNSGGDDDRAVIKRVKPPFRPAKDDTKPLLQDPILRSDPIETEEAVLMLPPIRPKTSSVSRR